MIPQNGVCMTVIPSLWVCFSIIGVPQNGYVFQSLTHTYSIDKSNQVPWSIRLQLQLQPIAVRFHYP